MSLNRNCLLRMTWLLGLRSGVWGLGSGDAFWDLGLGTRDSRPNLWPKDLTPKTQDPSILEERKNSNIALCHFQYTEHRVACGKPPVVP